MIAIAAGGGGITASLWTATVLDGLGSIPGFHDHVALVSSVSGGGVAGMYYVDGFSAKADKIPTERLLEKAGRSSLRAVTWGMAWAEWRPSGGMRDRGWALESHWSRKLEHPDALLDSWADGIAAGWRPIQIFNATSQETGCRQLFAAADLTPPAETINRVRMRVDMGELLPDCQVGIATAARLSATFPFVSPLARPRPGPRTDVLEHHSADGGYFDNSGLSTALEVVDDYLRAVDGNAHARRIAIVEIRATSEVAELTNGDAERPSGMLNNFLGPLETLHRVRATTQAVRGAVEFEAAQRRWQANHQVRAERFVFHLTDRLPLSWDLTTAERDLILAHWPTHPAPATLTIGETRSLAAACRHNDAELARLRVFLGEDSPRTAPAPPDVLQVQQNEAAARRKK